MADNRKLLLVDDNPKVLGMLRLASAKLNPPPLLPHRSPATASARVSPKKDGEEDVLLDG